MISVNYSFSVIKISALSTQIFIYMGMSAY